MTKEASCASSQPSYNLAELLGVANFVVVDVLDPGVGVQAAEERMGRAPAAKIAVAVGLEELQGAAARGREALQQHTLFRQQRRVEREGRPHPGKTPLGNLRRDVQPL